MDVVKLGKKGQVSIPRSVLQRLGLGGDEMLLVETTSDGAIVLRPSGVYPLELYDDARVQELLAEDNLPSEVRERIEARLGQYEQSGT